jgi:hypothetical protein
MHTVADPRASSGLALTPPRAERLRLTLGALGAAALTLLGLHGH